MQDEPLTDEELNEIERRGALATPGPWIPFLESREGIGGASFIRLDASREDTDLEMYVSYSPPRSLGPDESEDADLDFIAHARSDVPRLIAEIRRLLEAPGTMGHEYSADRRGTAVLRRIAPAVCRK